jgi:hypothetical protein
MTQEEVMQTLTDMGLHEGGMANWVADNAWWKFANVVVQHEREACADIAENWNSNGMPRTGVANEIRARRNT